MEPTSRPAPSEDVLTAHLEGEAVLLHMETKNYHRLNATAALMWKGLERGLSPEAVLDEVLARYDVDRATAAAELDRLLAELGQRGLVR
jgi:hypothetical protein